jgi:hypothetical protein
MKISDLAQEIDIEFEAIEVTVHELATLRQDVALREPASRLAAAVEK